jgi:endonuclease III
VSSSSSLVAALRDFYGLQPQPPAELFQFVAWEVLSEHALPARRDRAWQALRQIPALTPDAMFRAPANELLEAIGLAGPRRDEKLARLRTTMNEIRRSRDRLDATSLGSTTVLQTARSLRQLSSVDDCVLARALLYVAGHLVLPVDDDIGRVVTRLSTPTSAAPRRSGGASTSQRQRREARRWLAARLPRDQDAYRGAVTYVRHHGQHTCLVAGPHCTICPLREQCASS